MSKLKNENKALKEQNNLLQCKVGMLIDMVRLLPPVVITVRDWPEIGPRVSSLTNTALRFLCRCSWRRQDLTCKPYKKATDSLLLLVLFENT
jgi:hypothetical protein